MSEWNQTPLTPETGSSPTETPSPAVPSTPWYRAKWVFGTCCAAVVAVTVGVVVQVFKPGSATAIPDKDPGFRGQKYLARVNGELVSYKEIADECVARYGSEVLQQVINRKIVQQACGDRGIEVTRQEVEQEIAKIAQQFKMPKTTWLQMLQAERKLSPAQYRRDIIWPMIALRKLSAGKFAITADELTKAFEQLYGEKVRAKVIMLDNFRTAQKCATALRRDPKQFEELVRQYSIEPNSRALDGAIPPIHRWYSVPKLERAAFELKEGDISGIIQVDVSRYVIMKCEGRTERIVTHLSEVKEDLEKQLLERKQQEAVVTIFNKLRADAKIANYLTATAPQATGKGKAPAKPKNGQPFNAGIKTPNK